MLVVLSIIMVITLVAITSQSTFNKTLLLSNTAYDVALSIRTAQVQGIEGSTPQGGTLKNIGYGFWMRSSSPTSYKIFADTAGTGCSGGLPNCSTGDGWYNSITDGSSYAKTYNINNNISITNWCVYDSSGAGVKRCMNDTDALSELDITFSRGHPDPTIHVIDQNFLYTNTLFSSACLKLTSPYGGARYVLVGGAGAISVSSTGSSTYCP